MVNSTLEKPKAKNLSVLTKLVEAKKTRKNGKVKYQPNPYIRKKIVNGKPYYYACWYERQPDSSYKEMQVYLGDAAFIIEATLGKRGKRTSGN